MYIYIDMKRNMRHQEAVACADGGGVCNRNEKNKIKKE